MKFLLGLIYILATTSNVLAQFWSPASRGGDISLTIKIPSFPAVGDEAVLESKIDLAGNPLKSITWFKDEQVFFIITSRGSEVKPVLGIEVDEANSSQEKVTLLNVNELSSGMYRCEVKAGGRMLMKGAGMMVMKE